MPNQQKNPQQSQQSHQSKVDQACARLEAAVIRLEAALKAKSDGNGSGNGAGNGALSKELAAMRDENAALIQINEKVSGRLDNAIGRLKGILE